MPPQPILRIYAESLAAKGRTPAQIAAETGMNAEYARKVVNVVNGNEGGDESRPTAEDHAKHVFRAVSHGGFRWLSHDQAQRFYRLEAAPKAGPTFGLPA